MNSLIQPTYLSLLVIVQLRYMFRLIEPSSGATSHTIEFVHLWIDIYTLTRSPLYAQIICYSFKTTRLLDY
jgi:hypothetical protein